MQASLERCGWLARTALLLCLAHEMPCQHPSMLISVYDLHASRTGAEVLPEQCQVAERLHGKFLSVKATARVAHPEVIAAVYAELEKDARVIMKF